MYEVFKWRTVFAPGCTVFDPEIRFLVPSRAFVTKQNTKREEDACAHSTDRRAHKTGMCDNVKTGNSFFCSTFTFARKENFLIQG